MNTFTINGKKYTAPKFDFNTVCYFEEAGISLAEGRKKPSALIRAYFAILFDGDKEEAGKELEAHMVNGGTFDEMMTAMTKEMNESDFFQKITEKTNSKKKQTEKSADQ